MQHIVLIFNIKLTNIVLIIFNTFKDKIGHNGSIHGQIQHFYIL